MERRIRAEIKKTWMDQCSPHFRIHSFKEQGYNFLAMFDERINNTIIFDIFIEDAYHFKILLDIPKDYPFKAPTVYIRNICGDQFIYLTMLRQEPKFWKEYLNIGPECLCCCSKTCGDNWSPTYHMLDLIKEVCHNLMYKLRKKDIFMAKSVTRQLWGNGADGFPFPVEKYL